MDGLVDLDDRDLGDGDVGGEETSIEEVGRLEFFQRLRVELCLEVLEDVSKVFSYKKKKDPSVTSRVGPKNCRLTQDLQAGRVDGTWKRRGPRGEWRKESSSREI